MLPWLNLGCSCLLDVVCVLGFGVGYFGFAAVWLSFLWVFGLFAPLVRCFYWCVLVVSLVCVLVSVWACIAFVFCFDC